MTENTYNILFILSKTNVHINMINITDAHTLTKRRTYPVKKIKSENSERKK